MCVCVVIPFILDVRLVDAPAGVTQEEGHTGFLHLFLLWRLPSFFSREGFSRPFPSTAMKLKVSRLPTEPPERPAHRNQVRVLFYYIPKYHYSYVSSDTRTPPLPSDLVLNLGGRAGLYLLEDMVDSLCMASFFFL